MSLFLGIDTSNYTTSAAAVGEKTENIRKIIDIKEGMRGIRQSDGVFAHLKELPNLLEKMDIDMKRLDAVGVSVRPRNREDSYMPVFVAGESFARTVARTLDIPLFRYSHQDGHIMAGILSGGCTELLEGEFAAVHLSGGTTEILSCKYENNCFNAEIIGGTKDISAGQLIDRLGVKLGMKFPCGCEMDALSLTASHELKLKTCTDKGYINFSGPETALLRMTETENEAVLARTAIMLIGKSLKEAIEFLKPKRILFVGGVASNTILREYLEDMPAKVFFAQPELSSDNAVGIAELCRREWENKWNR